MSTMSEHWRAWSCTVRVTLQSAGPAELALAVEATRRVMDEVQRSIDRFDPTSDLSRVNASAGRLVPVAPLTLSLVGIALDAARRTDGLCDPTIGRALLQSGYSADISELRGRTSRAQQQTPVAGWQSVTIDRPRGAIAVRPDGLLDVGAMAKAWTADTAARAAASRSGRAALVSIGGDLAVAAAPLSQTVRPWLVDVSETEHGRGQQIALTHGGVASSSTTGRRWNTTMGPRHHLIDPTTGASADGPWRTCSVWAQTAQDANEASTAALICADAPRWLGQRRIAARLVHRDGWVLNTGAWPMDAAVVA